VAEGKRVAQNQRETTNYQIALNSKPIFTANNQKLILFFLFFFLGLFVAVAKFNTPKFQNLHFPTPLEWTPKMVCTVSCLLHLVNAIILIYFIFFFFFFFDIAENETFIVER
jgi:hypothetical protein